MILNISAERLGTCSDGEKAKFKTVKQSLNGRTCVFCLSFISKGHGEICFLGG